MEQKNNSSMQGSAGTLVKTPPPQPSPHAEAKTQHQPRPANQPIKRVMPVRVIPLGGLGEIGKNMNAIEYGEDIIVIDMGFKFPTEDEPGIDYVIPDTTYLEKNRHKIRGHVITHGHEDHIGGIPYILPKLPAPIYGARFTLGMIEKKLVEHHIKPTLRVMDPDKHERVQLGAFTVELVRVTHSIPDACAVVIDTPVGRIVNPGDWRFDLSPIDNKPPDIERLKQLGEEGVMLFMGDSTSATRPGKTHSEKTIEPAFHDLFERVRGRMIIATFASQINRVQLIMDAAHKTGRKVAFNGRSMLANVELAVKLGYLRIPAGMIVRMSEVVNLPDHQVVILCTGSQGEVNASLSRMARGEHKQIKIKPGDAVIMSSSVIPGNELSVIRSMDALMRGGAHVYHDTTREIDGHGRLHTSGHAYRDELIEMISMIKPKYLMPVHGDFNMQMRHAQLAVELGIPKQNIFVLDNGDVLELTPTGARKGEKVPSGVIMIDGAGVADAGGVVLRDRMAMGANGIFVIVATVSKKSGQLVSSPDIVSRGFIYMKDNEDLINRARNEVKKAFGHKKKDHDWTKFKLRLRDDIGNFLYRETQRNPIVITVVNEV